MPNWCATTITFNGDPEKIKILHDFIKDREANKKVKIENGFGADWLGNFLERAGISYHDYECRGSVVYVGGNEGNFFDIDTETAWVPMMQIWKAIVDKIVPGIEITYIADEPGNGVYMTNDPKYENRYHVELFEDETGEVIERHFTSDDSDWTEENLRKEILSIFPGEDALSTTDLIEKLEYEYDGISIHPWEFIEIEGCN